MPRFTPTTEWEGSARLIVSASLILAFTIWASDLPGLAFRSLIDEGFEKQSRGGNRGL